MARYTDSCIICGVKTRGFELCLRHQTEKEKGIDNQWIIAKHKAERIAEAKRLLEAEGYSIRRN